MRLVSEILQYKHNLLLYQQMNSPEFFDLFDLFDGCRQCVKSNVTKVVVTKAVCMQYESEL